MYEQSNCIFCRTLAVELRRCLNDDTQSLSHASWLKCIGALKYIKKTVCLPLWRSHTSRIVNRAVLDLYFMQYNIIHLYLLTVCTRVVVHSAKDTPIRQHTNCAYSTPSAKRRKL